MSRSGSLATTLVIFFLVKAAHTKVYERCELARELRYSHHVPEVDIPVWVCIARYESDYNTTAVGRMGDDGSGDHGLFQISDLYWCSPPGHGRACGLTCAQLEDDDIADDVVCAKRVHREHSRLSGNGFTAWVVYTRYCTPDVTEKFVEDCFDTRDNELHTDVVQEEELRIPEGSI